MEYFAYNDVIPLDFNPETGSLVYEFYHFTKSWVANGVALHAAVDIVNRRFYVVLPKRVPKGAESFYQLSNFDHVPVVHVSAQTWSRMRILNNEVQQAQ